MSVSASIPATIEIRRSHLLGLIGGVAALAACITWVVTAFAFGTGTSGAASSPPAVAAARHVPATVMSRTPAQLAGVGLGTGYQLPGTQTSPTAADILASMSPETRRYTESIMNLTFGQLAAGAAGHP